MGNLTISRRAGESVWIGDCRVKIIRTTPSVVTIKITADDSVVIARDEIKERPHK